MIAIKTRYQAHPCVLTILAVDTQHGLGGLVHVVDRVVLLVEVLRALAAGHAVRVVDPFLQVVGLEAVLVTGDVLQKGFVHLEEELLAVLQQHRLQWDGTSSIRSVCTAD